jgi:hypothetical protein
MRPQIQVQRQSRPERPDEIRPDFFETLFVRLPG